MSDSYAKLREDNRNLETVNKILWDRDLTLASAYFRLTKCDYRSCDCPGCCAARASQGIAKDHGQQRLRGVG
jgi:hypothetical protein